MTLNRPGRNSEPEDDVDDVAETRASQLSTQPPNMDASFVLSELEVYNWGPFRGLHRAEFDDAGAAIIGPTGSGKTTLVDALMTLLVAQPRYNLASTGGHESDRTLIEYVRGVLGGDGADGRQEVARPGKTISGVCGTYKGGAHVVKLAGLFWTEGTGNAADDLKRRWVFSQAADQTFTQWLQMLHDDGVRDLLKMGRETADLRIFDSKRAYLERLRKFFDVGENAFTLLNRAAGLKQLNSIDEIFRELVLDDRAAFDRAIEVAAEFDNLSEIHAELELAKKQQESLTPVKEEHDRLAASRKKTETWRKLKKTAPIWFANAGLLKWNEEARDLQASLERSHSSLHEFAAQLQSQQAEVDALRERYLELGGNVIGELQNTIHAQQRLVAERRKHAQQYQSMLASLGMNDELSDATLAENKRAVTLRLETEREQLEIRKGDLLEASLKLREAENRTSEVEQTLNKVRQRPGSNIPPNFQDFRAELASQLNLRDSDLPFLAELVEVKATEAAWRGAIERALGSERLRVLVPEQLLDQALRWVNHRDNRLHVRLQSAAAREERLQFFADGFVQKLNFKQHPLASAAQKLMSGRDLHCVSSAEALRRTEHGLTIEGMISGRQGKFEKQDQRRLDQDWMTGFDNKDQLESLVQQLSDARNAVDSARIITREHEALVRHVENTCKVLESLATLEFATIDLPSAEGELSRSELRLKALLDPLSDASQAKFQYDVANQRLEATRQEITEVRTNCARLEDKLSSAIDARETARRRIGDGLSEADSALVAKHLRLDMNIPAQKLDDQERRSTHDIDEALAKQVERDAEIELQLVRKMEYAKRVDNGALVEVGSTIDDVPHYLERLRTLTQEALPEKRSRFLEYLNRSSDQGVTQLLASIDEEVDAIEQRIGELNHTLVKVDFRSGRYLQLLPQRIKDERLRALHVAMQKVRHAALKDDGGESHFKSLQDMVAILRDAGQNRRLQGSKALLDPRFRLQFYVVEVDRQTGDRSPPRTGSQSGSGGEKELMASHILTASLSYALCPSASTRPLYATVILDEAFSKSSPSAASRIIEALRIFSLHPIFVTPNKEIGLLKQHTRKVICVQRPGKEASLASISWERLEELARSP
ncbi:MAG: ATP-binding protein [Pirellulales bacterium]